MLHSAVCQVHIDPAPERGYWTNGDPVTGYVELEVKREVHVASIEAQLRCEDRGRAYVRDNEELVDLSAAHFDDFEVLWKSEPINFDLPNSNGDLAKGHYKFPFSFRMPEQTDKLPSSFNVEPRHDFNGTFWGVYAVIDRDTRLRSNYRGFGETHMLPHRIRSFTGQSDSFTTVTNKTHLKLHRRPSFLMGENAKNIVEVEGRLAVPTNGLMQLREQFNKSSGELPEIRIAARTPDEELALVKEVVVFIDTTIYTTVNDTRGMSQTNAIVIAKECNEVLRGGTEWQDLSPIIESARIYGLPETWTSKIHDIKHKIRVQLILAPVSKPTRTSILELSTPVILHSEATTTDSNQSAPPPPPYAKTEASA